jgi:hypothetical protein
MNNKDEEISCTCGICMEGYSQENKPLILSCGHTFCEACYKQNIKSNKKECSYCKKSFTHNPSPPTNFQLLEIVNFIEKTKIDTIKKCAKHNEGEFYCLNCYTFNCIDCIPSHLEEDHQLRKIKPKILDYSNQCQAFYKETIRDKFFSDLNKGKEQFMKDFSNSTIDKIKKEKELIDSKFKSKVKQLELEKKKALDHLDSLEQEFKKFNEDIKNLDSYILKYISNFCPFIGVLSKINLEIKDKINLLYLIEENNNSKLKFQDILDQFKKDNSKMEVLKQYDISQFVISTLNKAYEEVLKITSPFYLNAESLFSDCVSISNLRKNCLVTFDLGTINKSMNMKLTDIYNHLEESLNIQ